MTIQLDINQPSENNNYITKNVIQFILNLITYGIDVTFKLGKGQQTGPNSSGK